MAVGGQKKKDENRVEEGMNGLNEPNEQNEWREK